jgi:hypothetical protein
MDQDEESGDVHRLVTYYHKFLTIINDVLVVSVPCPRLFLKQTTKPRHPPRKLKHKFLFFLFTLLTVLINEFEHIYHVLLASIPFLAI